MGFMGAVTGTEGLRVTHMLYTDDLTLTANDPAQLQEMLRRLESYAARKGLTVNVQKSYIVNFNAYQNSTLPIFRLYNQELEERDFFYLCTWECYLIKVNLHHAASHALRPLNAALCSLVLKKGCLTGLMRCCGFSRHMRCQLACMPVRFGLRNF